MSGPQGKRVRLGIRVWPVNGSMIKEELYRWLRLDRPTEESGEPYPPGYCHFPKYGEEYFKQLTAEQLVTRVVKGYRRARVAEDQGSERSPRRTRICAQLRPPFTAWIASMKRVGKSLNNGSLACVRWVRGLPPVRARPAGAAAACRPIELA